MDSKEKLARDIISYVMGNDILTQHGMRGLRLRLQAAIPDDVGAMYRAMLTRADELMSAGKYTKEGLELDILVSAIEAHERKLVPELSRPTA